MWITPQLVFMVLVMSVAFVKLMGIPKGQWKPSTVLVILVGLALWVEASGSYLSYRGENNSMLYNVFLPIEFVLVLGVLLRIRPQWRITWAVSLVVGLLGIGYCYVKGYGKGFIVVEAALVISLILSVGIMATLWSLADRSTRALAKVPEFWLLVGMLLYFGGMVPLIGLTRSVFELDMALAKRLWMIAPYLCIMRYAFTAYAAILAQRSGPNADG